MKTAIQQAIEMQKEHLKVFKVSLSLEKVGSIEYLKLLGLITYLESSIEYHLPTLLPTERQIIEDAWADGYNECDFGDELGSAFSSPTDYYNKTFNNQTDKNGTAMTANHTANGRNYLIAQVPKEASDFQIASDVPRIDYMHCNGINYIPLPSGQYRILFIAEDATEEQAVEVVDGYDSPTGGDDYQDYYRNYEGSQNIADFPWIAGEPLKSLSSLIRSKFTQPNQRKHLIIEKID